MPYGIPAGGVVELRINGRQENQQTLTILHWQLAPESTGVTDGAAALSAFDAQITDGDGVWDSFKACTSIAWTLVSRDWQWIAPLRYRTRSFGVLGDQGNNAGVCLPVNDSVAITKQADRAGRRGVGTIHMPGVPQSFVTGGSTLTAGAATNYDTFAIQCKIPISAETGGNLQPIIFHRTTPNDSRIWTEHKVQPYTRTMRRRTVGLGS